MSLSGFKNCKNVTIIVKGIGVQTHVFVYVVI